MQITPYLEKFDILTWRFLAYECFGIKVEPNYGPVCTNNNWVYIRRTKSRRYYIAGKSMEREYLLMVTVAQCK